MVYEPLYHTREIASIKLPSGCSNQVKSAKSVNVIIILLMIFNKTNIPLTLVGYKMIKANSALHALLAIYHFISNACSWNNSYVARGSYTLIYPFQFLGISDYNNRREVI